MKQSRKQGGKQSSLFRVVLIGMMLLSSALSMIGLSQPSQADSRPDEQTVIEGPLSQADVASTHLSLANLQGSGVILLDPFIGPTSIPVTVNGQNWAAGSQVVVYLVFEGEEFAIANTQANDDGMFTVSFFMPSGLADENSVTVLARTVQGDASAQAFYNIVEGLPDPEDEEEAPEATPDPVDPRGVVTANRLNVRSGPGLIYPVIGQVQVEDEVDISGQNSGWWRIEFLNALSDFGWVSGNFIDAEDVDDVPLVQAPAPPPPTPAPTPTPTPQPTVQECNPGQWSGCSPSFCPVEYVSQCQGDGTWGQCVWDPGSCSVYNNPTGGEGGDDDDNGDDDDDADDDDEDDNDDGDDDDDDWWR